MLDCAEALTADDTRLLEDTAGVTRLVVANKSDQPAAWSRDEDAIIGVSACTGAGIDGLRQAIVDALAGGEPLRDPTAISNVRHASLLARARMHLAQAQRAASEAGTSEEFLLVDLHSARVSLGEILGAHTSEDVLAHIFERFCIGK